MLEPTPSTTANPPKAPISDVIITFRRTLVVIGVLVMLGVAWFAHDVFLLVFAGLLFGILLHGIAKNLSRYTKLGKNWSLFLTLFILLFLSVLIVRLLAPGVTFQVTQLEHDLPRSIDQLRAYIGQYSWGDDLLSHLPTIDDLATGSDTLLKRLTGAFSASLNVIVHVILILVTGIYIAAEPRLYRGGFLQMVPPRRRRRINQVLTQVHDSLWWWLLSVIGAMLSISVLSFIGLSILQIPLALTLALLTGMLTFIPNFGQVLSAILPTLLALMVSPGKALSVIIMYVLIQFIESHFVTPLIQRHTIKMPPALGIGAQLVFGLLFGFMGLLLAIPITAAIMVLVNNLYISPMTHSVEIPTPAEKVELNVGT